MVAEKGYKFGGRYVITFVRILPDCPPEADCDELPLLKYTNDIDASNVPIPEGDLRSVDGWVNADDLVLTVESDTLTIRGLRATISRVYGPRD